MPGATSDEYSHCEKILLNMDGKLMITTFGTRVLSRRFKLPDEPSFRTYLRKEIALCPRTAK
jgi:hypothetical protein